MTQPTDPKWLVLVTHGGPAVCVREAAPRPADSTGSSPAVERLRREGLLVERPSLEENSTHPDVWAYRRLPPKLPRLKRLLTALVMEARYGVGAGFGVPRERLVQKGFRSGHVKDKQVNDELRLLRQIFQNMLPPRFPGEEAPNPVLGGEAPGLDHGLVRCDWIDVLRAEQSAKAWEKNAYQRAHALAMAERAFVESLWLTPRDVMRQAIAEPPEYIETVVHRRWALRQQYLEALAEIDHTDAMVVELRMWTRLLAEQTRVPSKRLKFERCRDEFFGVEVPLLDRFGRARPAIEALGSMPVPHAKSLAHAAKKEPPVVPAASQEDLEDIESRVADAKAAPPPKRPSDEVRLDDIEMPKVAVEWRHLDALMRMIHNKVVAACDGATPQVIVSIGRGGSVLGAGLSEVLPCRAVGFVAIDRYKFEGKRSSDSPFIRGHELPNRRACLVLVCEDVVARGKTVEDVIKHVVRPHYPHAEIVVATLFMNTAAKAIKIDDVRWVAGIEIDVAKTQPVWINFCWKLGADAVHVIEEESPVGDLEVDVRDGSSTARGDRATYE